MKPRSTLKVLWAALATGGVLAFFWLVVLLATFGATR